MGNYYKFVNHVRKERVEPVHIDGDGVGIKWSSIIWGSMSHLFTYLSIQDKDWVIISDSTSDDVYFECKSTYMDITEQVIQRYNDACPFPEEKLDYRR